MRVKQRERAFRTSTMLCILAVCLALALALCSPRSDAADLSVSPQVVPSHRTFYAVCKLGLTLETVGNVGPSGNQNDSGTRADHQRRLATTGWVLLCGRGVAEREDAPDGSSMTSNHVPLPDSHTRLWSRYHDTTTPHTVRRRRSGARDRRVRSVQTGRATAAAGKTGR